VVTISIINPTESGVYPPGQKGNIEAIIEKSGIVFPWETKVFLYDAQNIRVWEGQAGITEGRASLNLTWPSEEGLYVVEVQCSNVIGSVLASARRQFAIRRSSPTPQPAI
jgi:hypothetical protein